MDESEVRRAGRVTLIGACAVCMVVLFVHMQTPFETSEHVALDAFWQSVFVAPVIGAVLLVSDLLLGSVDRRSDGGRAALVLSVAAVATGIVLSAALTALVLHETPPVTVAAAEGRAELEGMLDRLVAAAGTDPVDLAGMMARLPHDGTMDCRDGRNRLIGESLHWTAETRTTVPGSALARTEYGVAVLRPETMAAGARMVELLRAEGYVVDDDSSSTAIAFWAHRAPDAPSMQFSARLQGTSTLLTSMRASSACLRQDR